LGLPLMKNIKNYLQEQDELLGEYLNVRPAIEVTANHNISLFQALTKSIVSQQLSGKAATTIFQRLVTNMGCSGTIRPEAIAICSTDSLRACGLSQNKARTIISTAREIVERSIPDQIEMEAMEDTDIISCLTKIKGIGRWTAEMILIFKLGRPNVMPVTDLGIQKGYALIFGLKSKPTPATILDRSRLWEPYRSTVALHCWNAADDVEWSL